ncbi:MAG TPA: alpha/beta hydrolase [Candidatus Dormibacteraeota bacterium]
MSEFLSAPWLAAFRAAADADPELAVISERSRFRLLLRSADRVCLVVFNGGIVDASLSVSIDDSWDFTLSAPPPTWQRFLEPMPPRHHHDLFAMWMRVGDFRVDGDRRLFMASARVVRRLSELAREVVSGPSARDAHVPGTAVGLEPITGRYLWLDFEGRRYRVYFEEAGVGSPLLLLHTAGADSRQFMHMLNDSDLTSRWRLIAFDLPRHGRSMPPEGWWQDAYHLTTDFYADFTAAFAAALGLQRTVALGCSMGGEIVLELALRRPDLFAGVIACEGADRVQGRRIGWTNHPEVNESEAVPAWVDGLVAPSSPELHRREIWWIYSQAGAAVFNGDIDFYSSDWNAQDRVGAIDTSACAVHLMTGDYDYSCTLELSEATAARIRGAQFHPMPGLGHFPITENPPLFKRYLLPVLDDIEELMRSS